ncbi:hypothetical protein BGZ94_008939 [Podila epigama]|nr:hypothetical protein BGZ94_008939 [Podila epigama]
MDTLGVATVKSFFKKPDWDIAAQYYEKAAQSFKAAKSYEQAVQAFVKTSEAMVNATSLFMAGRALENSGNIALQNLGQPERAADMYKRASELFMQNMTPDRAAEMLEKSAKAMEPISVDAAIDLYIGACNIYENEDRAKYASDTFKRTIALLVKHKRFEKAIEILQRLGNVQKESANKSALFKTFLSIIIIQLAAGDENYYNQTAARQHVGFLDNEVARLARNIVISNDLVTGMGSSAVGGFDGQQQQPYQGGQFDNHGNQGFHQQQFQQPPSHPQHQNQYQQPSNFHQGPPQQLNQPQPQRPNTSGGYNISPSTNANNLPPSHNQGHLSNEREEADWRALTQNQPQLSSASPHQGQYQQHPGAPPRMQGTPSSGRNYYDDDGDDGLL